MRKPNLLLLEYSQRSQHYKPLMDCFDANYSILDKFSKNYFDEFDIDLTVCADECVPDTFRNILSSKKAGVPVLHIPDGILEWRNIYEHQRAFSSSLGMPLHQPHVSDKIACIGRNQARMMESWGSLGKCEVVGCARFDSYIGCASNDRKDDEPFRILITTAKTIAFTIEQELLIVESYKCLFDWLENIDYVISGRKIELLYRSVNDGIQFPNNEHYIDCSGCSLQSSLMDADAVVSTPSTVILEAMLHEVPVVKMDYTNSPCFVPAVWNITAPQHIESVFTELINPPPPKILHQNIILHDCLECMSPAKERLVRLVESMIETKLKCVNSKSNLSFSHRIIPISPYIDAHVEQGFDLKELYPNHPVFSNMDTIQLQLENGQLSLQIEELKLCIEKLVNSLSWRVTLPLRKIVEFWLHCNRSD